MQGVEILGAVFFDHDHIFDAHSSVGSAVQAGLHGKDLPVENGLTSIGQQDRFVNIQSDAVTGSVAH